MQTCRELKVLLKTPERISPAKGEKIGCQEPEGSSIEGESASSSKTPSLSSRSSWARHHVFSATLVFVYFSIFRKRVTFARIRDISSSARSRSDSSFSWVFSRVSHDVPTQGRPRRTHSAHLGWSSMIKQETARSQHRTQAVMTRRGFF